jgi:hypothetical protein
VNKTAVRFAPLIAVLLLCMAARADDAPVSFRNEVAPILVQHCLACHDQKKAKGEYRIETFEQLIRPGGRKLAAVAPGKPDESELFVLITETLAEERMPRDADPLPAAQIERIKRWIEQGAKFDGEKPDAPLVSIVPVREHPRPPEAYPGPIAVTALAFSPDGKLLIGGGYHELTVWNAETGELLRRVAGFAQRTYDLEFSPDGKLLAVAGGTPGQVGEVRLLNGETLELRQVLHSAADAVFDAAFDPKGERLAVAGAAGQVHVFDAASGAPIRSINAHSDWVLAVSFSGDGKQLATASRDKSAKVFDVESGDQVAAFTGHDEQVSGVAFHPEGKQVYSTGRDRKIRLWSIDEAKQQWDHTVGGELFKPALHAENGAGEFLFVPSADGKARQYRLSDRNHVREYGGHTDWAVSAAFHKATGRVAVGGFNGEVRVFSTEDGKQTAVFIAAPGLETASE